MQQRAMIYFDAVVRAGSVRKGAAALGIASSSVSRQITELEAQLGVPLFDRLPGRMRLTAAGELFLAHVRRTIRENDRILAQIAELAEPGSGSVSIAATGGLAGSFVPGVSLGFVNRYPLAKVMALSKVRTEIVHAVTEGDADLGLGYNLPRDPDLHVVEAFALRAGAVVGNRHPLAKRDTVRLSECAEFPIVAPDASSSLLGSMQYAFERSRAAYRTRIETNSSDLIKYTLMESDAVSFLSLPDVFEEVSAAQLVFIPIEERVDVTHNLVLVQRANAVLNRTASLFAEAVSTALREIARVHEGRLRYSAGSE